MTIKFQRWVFLVSSVGIGLFVFTNCSSKSSEGNNKQPGPAATTPKVLWQKYSADHSQADIWAMKLDGSEPVNLTPSTGTIVDFDPQWSNDHTKIVFTSTRRASNPDIYVMNANGSNVIPLTAHNAFETFGSFSPDGTKVMFTRTTSACTDADGIEGQIHLMDANGANVTPVTGSSCDEEPDFSPDGTKILFDSDRSGRYQIYVMNLNGTNVVQLTNTAGTIQNRYPQWSPDGLKIVFGRRASANGPTEVYTMNANGSGLSQLTSNPGLINSDPSWSSDGTQIIFASTRDGGGDAEIYIMDADGSNETNLTNDSTFLDAGPFAW